MHQYGYIGRKMRLPQLQEKPAIVMVTFGSTGRNRLAIDGMRERLESQGFASDLFWAYTSAIIRKKQGLPGLHETLARVEAAGYRKAVVQPLHIFPGTEYQELYETCSYFPGMRVIVGETLCHRWGYIRDVLEMVSADFLPPQEGLNLLVLHGTPLAADPVNIVYLGLERLVRDLYPNVIAASIEGVPDFEAVFARMERKNVAGQYQRVKIIPLMFYAGVHAEEDLMGDEESWRGELEKMGFTVECSMLQAEEQSYFKGLAMYPECLDFFVDRLNRALTLFEYY